VTTSRLVDGFVARTGVTIARARRSIPRAWAQALPRVPPTSSNPDILKMWRGSAHADLAAMAQPHAVAVAKHNYTRTPGRAAATVKISARSPNRIAEFFINLKPMRVMP